MRYLKNFKPSKNAAYIALYIVSLIVILVIVFVTYPQSDPNVEMRGSTSFVPYGSKLVIVVSRSTCVLIAHEEYVEKRIHFFGSIPWGITYYSDPITVVKFGPLMSFTVVRVPGGIEVTKPWYAVFW